MYQSFEVAVDGGLLHVGRWGCGEQVLLAAHGITATHRSFLALADQLGNEISLVAPDLRGRGGSNGITAPFSMAAHADDLASVLDWAGIDQALVLGHSMGAFAAVVLAAHHPARVSRLVLVDGGVPLHDAAVPESADIGQIVQAVIGPALQRLRMTFPSVEAYLDFWRAHPALAEDWSDYIVDAYTYDLVGDAPELRSGVSERAVLADAESELIRDDVARAIGQLGGLRIPTILVSAPTGIFNQEPGLYTDSTVLHWKGKFPQLRHTVVPAVNHYTILMSERGAKAIADIVQAELRSR